MSAAITQIDYSETESETLRLKIARCNNDFFNEKELYKQIAEQRYDICRLKVSAEDEFAQHRLHQTGMPAFFSGSIRRYKTKINEAPSGNYNYPDLIWEYYNGTQNELLFDMLKGTWGTYPIGYYRTPFLSELVNKETEIESVFRFYKNQNNPNINANNTFVFIKHGENYVGFFALNKVNGNLESHVGGILEPYRKGGYFLDKLRYIKQYCISNNLAHFMFGARNENAAVQRIFQFAGFQPVGSENVFHIAALLGYSQLPPVTKTFTFSKREEISEGIFQWCTQTGDKYLPKSSAMSFRINYVAELPLNKQVLLQCSFPVATGKNFLAVVTAAENSQLFSAYFEK